MKTEIEKIKELSEIWSENISNPFIKKKDMNLELKKIKSEADTSNLVYKIDTNIIMATTINKLKIDEGWTDSGKKITFTEALSLLN